jgi:hypothetical protein
VARQKEKGKRQKIIGHGAGVVAVGGLLILTTGLIRPKRELFCLLPFSFCPDG